MNDMIVKVDPTESFKGISKSKLVAAVGILPYFAAEVSLSGPESVSEAFDMLMECYGFGMGQDGSGWGTVDSDGMYVSQHEGDPDLAPMVAFSITPDITFYVYQHSITATTDGETTLIARMD